MTLHAIPVAGAFPSNRRRALTTGITMYKKFLHVFQKPSERMNRRTDAAFAYVVQGHSLPERRKKFMTLSSREVCENAWYTSHGVSR